VFAERVAFLVAIGLVLLYASAAAAGFPARARIFPQLVSLAALLLVMIEIARLLWRRFIRLEGDAADARSALVVLRAGAPYVAWIAGYYAAIWLVGFLAASLLFVVLFLTLVARVTPLRALLVALSLGGVLLGLRHTLDVRWPEPALRLPSMDARPGGAWRAAAAGPVPEMRFVPYYVPDELRVRSAHAVGSPRRRAAVPAVPSSNR
jgi:hypothetical protein